MHSQQLPAAGRQLLATNCNKCNAAAAAAASSDGLIIEHSRNDCQKVSLFNAA